MWRIRTLLGKLSLLPIPARICRRFSSSTFSWINAASRRLIANLREKYPHAYILCTTTVMMHSPEWDKAIGEVVAAVADARVRQFRYTGNGAVTPGHVRRCEAETMARELANYIGTLPNVWED